MQRGGGPGGAGGAGNPTGGSFTGPAEALEILGNHAYAYSGQFRTSDAQTLTDMISFTSGNYYLVGQWTVCGAVNTDGSHVTGGIDQFYLSFNGITIQSLKTETGEEDQPGNFTVPIIIPAYTVVVCQGVSSQNHNDWTISQNLTGRIYRD